MLKLFSNAFSIDFEFDMRSNQNKKLVKKLSVTISMISYNDANIIDDCLKSIRNQDYGGEVKILMVDGGSTD